MAPQILVQLPNTKLYENLFNVHGSVHRNNILIYIQKEERFTVYLYLETALHVSGGNTTHNQKRIQLYLQHPSVICHTAIAICRYRGRVGTGLSVLWVAYATQSTLKPVPTLQR
jgi:hypothetical protein